MFNYKIRTVHFTNTINESQTCVASAGGVRVRIIWKLNCKLAKIDKMGGTAEIPVVQILQQISSVIVTDETRSRFKLILTTFSDFNAFFGSISFLLHALHVLTNLTMYKLGLVFN